jgi:hypothetical protein
MGRMDLMEDLGLFDVVVYVEMFQIQATDDCEIVTRVVNMLHDCFPGRSKVSRRSGWCPGLLKKEGFWEARHVL